MVKLTEEQKQRLRRDVAEKVMGWVKGTKEGYLGSGTVDWWVNGKGERQHPYTDTYDMIDYSQDLRDDYEEWKPDEDIATAWQVVKHLESQGYSWQVNKGNDNPWFIAQFNKITQPERKGGLIKFISGYSKSESPELAICLAAYRTITRQVWE